MSDFYNTGWLELIYQDKAGVDQILYIGKDAENPDSPHEITHTVKSEAEGVKPTLKKMNQIKVHSDGTAKVEPTKNNLAVVLRLCKAGIFKISNGGPFHDKIPKEFLQIIDGQGEVEFEDVDDIVSKFKSNEEPKKEEEKEPKKRQGISEEEFVKDILEEEGLDVTTWKIDKLRAVTAKLGLDVSGQSKDAYIPDVEKALIEKGYLNATTEG